MAQQEASASAQTGLVFCATSLVRSWLCLRVEFASILGSKLTCNQHMIQRLNPLHHHHHHHHLVSTTDTGLSHCPGFTGHWRARVHCSPSCRVTIFAVISVNVRLMFYGFEGMFYWCVYICPPFPDVLSWFHCLMMLIWWLESLRFHSRQKVVLQILYLLGVTWRRVEHHSKFEAAVNWLMSWQVGRSKPTPLHVFKIWTEEAQGSLLMSSNASNGKAR